MIQNFFSDDDFYLLRKHIKYIYDEAAKYIKNSNYKLNILEIGPSRETHFSEFEVDWIEKNARNFGHEYHSFDTQGNVDFIGTIENCKFLDETYDVVIALSVLEHVGNIFNASKEITRITKSHGKVFLETPFAFKIHGPVPDYWRITNFTYDFLFSDFFDIEINSFPDNQYEKNCIALSYAAVMTKL